MTVSQLIRPVLAGFSSATNDKLFDYTLPEGEREWTSGDNRRQFIQVLFDGYYHVDRITAAMISSDQTSDQFEWSLMLETSASRFESVVYGDDKNVGRPTAEYGFSVDNDPEKWPIHEPYQASRDCITLDKVINSVPSACGALLTMRGHGWFRAENLRFYGTLDEIYCRDVVELYGWQFHQDYPHVWVKE